MGCGLYPRRCGLGGDRFAAVARGAVAENPHLAPAEDLADRRVEAAGGGPFLAGESGGTIWIKVGFIVDFW